MFSRTPCRFSYVRIPSKTCEEKEPDEPRSHIGFLLRILEDVNVGLEAVQERGLLDLLVDIFCRQLLKKNNKRAELSIKKSYSCLSEIYSFDIIS